MSVTITNTLTRGFDKYILKTGIGQDKAAGAHKKAAVALALQLLNWTINGSARVNVTPPIKDGILRGSGSAFVGGEFVGDTKKDYIAGTPNTSYGDTNPNDITVGFNTSYAAKLHETNWTPGPASEQAGDVGNKFLEKHIEADGQDLTKLYAAIFKKETKA